MLLTGSLIPLPPFAVNETLNGFKVEILFRDLSVAELTLSKRVAFLQGNSPIFELDLPEEKNIQKEQPISLYVYDGEGIQLQKLSYDAEQLIKDIAAGIKLQVPITPAVKLNSESHKLEGTLGFQGNATPAFNAYTISAHFEETTGTSGTTLSRAMLGTVSDDGKFSVQITTTPGQTIANEGRVLLRVKYPNGQLAKEQHLKNSEPAVSTGNINIGGIETWTPPTLSTNPNSQIAKRQKVKGRVVDITGKYKIKNAQIIIWGWRSDKVKAVPILISTTDSLGSFSGEYPKGSFVDAYATIAGTLHDKSDKSLPVDLEIIPGQEPGMKFFPEFIYLAAEVPSNYGETEDDCDCKTLKSFELPDQEELVHQNSAYAQDIGLGCTNMVTPNRTLEEFSYHLIVRTTDPEIKGTTITDLERRRQAATFEERRKFITEVTARMSANIAIQPKDFTIEAKEAPQRPDQPAEEGDNPKFTAPTKTKVQTTNAAQRIALQKHDVGLGSSVNPSMFAMNNPAAIIGLAPGIKLPTSDLVQYLEEQQKTETNNQYKTTADRGLLNADNCVDWDNEPTFYQAVTIAHGHILRFKQIWKAAGYSLGDLLYSVPLAPGQKKNIVIFDWGREQTGMRDDQSDFSAHIDAFLSHQRDINSIVNASLAENSKGGSKANTSSKSGSIGGSWAGPLFGGALGISGGYSSSSGDAESSAWQDNGRQIAASTQDQLRDSVSQAASEQRNQRSTVVTTARQGERFKVETEVIANHNHCHALTIQYFEVLRHYVVEQKLVDVQECLFIPLLMSTFDNKKVLRWKEILKSRLLDPGFDPASNKTFYDAFDATQRIVNEYEGSDFPLNTYADEQIMDVSGDMHIRLRLNRPAPADNDEVAWPIVYRDFASLSGYTLQWIRTKLSTADIAKRDEVFDREIAPKVAEGFVNSLKIAAIDEAGRLVDFNLDVTLISDYKRDQDLFVTIRSKGVVPALKRRQISRVIIYSAYDLNANESSKAIVVNGRLDYRSRHSAGTLFADGNINNDLKSGGALANIFGWAVGDAVSIATPLNANELRNPRREDAELNLRLLQHLNANLEYYHKCIWALMDDDRRFMLLDGYLAPNTNPPRSVASVVVNKVLNVVGNSLVMAVAPGYRLDPTYQLPSEGLTTDDAVVVDENGNVVPQPKADKRPTLEANSLLEHYAPTAPSPPYRVSVPTRGVFAEAIQGACNSCEKLEEGRRDWADKDLDEPTAINPIQTKAPEFDPNQEANLRPNPMTQPVINIQNAPPAPAPGAGLTDALSLLGKASTFANITGLEGNQQNAIKAAAMTSEAAKHVADVSADLAKTQAILDNERAKNIQSQLDKAKDSGAITQEQYNEYTKKNFENQLGISDKDKNKDGGQGAANSGTTGTPPNGSPSGTTPGKTDGTDGQPSGDTGADKVKDEADAKGGIMRSLKDIQFFKQGKDKPNACWAAVIAMMLSWKNKKQYADIEAALKEAGEEYVKIYTEDTGLMAKDKDALLKKLGIEPKLDIQDFKEMGSITNFLDQHGPLWVTTDVDGSVDGKFSPHARLLVGIDGTDVLLLDPDPNKPEGVIKLSMVDFGKDFLAMATEGKGRQLVAFFAEKGVGLLSIANDSNTKGEGDGKNEVSIPMKEMTKAVEVGVEMVIDILGDEIKSTLFEKNKISFEKGSVSRIECLLRNKNQPPIKVSPGIVQFDKDLEKYDKINFDGISDKRVVNDELIALFKEVGLFYIEHEVYFNGIELRANFYPQFVEPDIMKSVKKYAWWLVGPLEGAVALTNDKRGKYEAIISTTAIVKDLFPKEIPKFKSFLEYGITESTGEVSHNNTTKKIISVAVEKGAPNSEKLPTFIKDVVNPKIRNINKNIAKKFSKIQSIPGIEVHFRIDIKPKENALSLFSSYKVEYTLHINSLFGFGENILSDPKMYGNPDNIDFHSAISNIKVTEVSKI